MTGGISISGCPNVPDTLNHHFPRIYPHCRACLHLHTASSGNELYSDIYTSDECHGVIRRIVVVEVPWLGCHGNKSNGGLLSLLGLLLSPESWPCKSAIKDKLTDKRQRTDPSIRTASHPPLSLPPSQFISCVISETY